MAARLPFGPFLCLAIIEWMLGGDWIRDRLTGDRLRGGVTQRRSASMEPTRTRAMRGRGC